MCIRDSDDWCGFFSADHYVKARMDNDMRTSFFHTKDVEGFFTYTWNCCGDPETLANHPELWDTWRHENGR